MRFLRPAAWLGLFLLACWLGFALWTTRYAMLDDALIHLRYAEFLHRTHHISYDGVHPTYGTSSLLYVSLLALLRGLTASPMLPKSISVLSYLGYLGVLLGMCFRLRKSPMARVLMIALLVSSISPMAIRWLADGMETSLVLIPVSLLALAVSRWGRRAPAGAGPAPVLLVLGIVMTFLRIEIASLAMLAGATLLCSHLALQHRERGSAVVQAAAAPVGALLTLGCVRVLMGHVLPDTALAKHSGASFAPVVLLFKMLGTSMLLGTGTLLVAAVSAATHLTLLVRRRAGTWRYAAWMFGNLMFPVLATLAGLRGQFIQGVRYELWTLVFGVVWNCMEINALAAAEPLRQPRSNRGAMVFAGAFAIYALCVFGFDYSHAMRAMQVRANTFLEMRDSGLERFRGQDIVAGDVGFIGYFSQANICDIDGLVNGRADAQLTSQQRLANCAGRHPQVVFLSPSQRARMTPFLDTSAWTACERVNFQNALQPDYHALLVSPEATPTLCPHPEPRAQQAGM